ncbi:flagellar assembly protein FliH [Lysinibacillus piscis]|uniref:flagellar assembly protein FliH n=1 Tax=Lysinibacillus piscis TaxID=2518931 RepID=UPI00223166C2|nr:flagellar assembly protein FliH [Lysinibacillus sp. KH24]
MSRIIRSIYAQSDENKVKEIKIREMFDAFEEDHEEVSLQEQMVDVLAERDRLLAEARVTLQDERTAFEQEQQRFLQEMEQMKRDWEEERPHRVQEAYDEGYGQGYEDGINKSNEMMAHALQTANDVINQAQDNARKYLEDQESIILELGLTTAERIIGVSLEQNQELFVEIVRRGLKEAREMKEIKIYVAPTYYALLTANRDELVEMFPVDVPFMIFVNEDLESDLDCFIETNHGRIVVSIDEQLNELRIKLRELLDSKE